MSEQNGVNFQLKLGEPGPTSTTSIKSGKNSIVTIEHGVSIRSERDPSKIYLVGCLQDRSLSMIASFTEDAEDPFTSIREWLEENFNPGPSAADKENGAELILVLPDPAGKGAPISRAFLAMAEKITVFRVHSTGFQRSDTPLTALDNGTLKVNLSADYPFIIGGAGSVEVGKGIKN